MNPRLSILTGITLEKVHYMNEQSQKIFSFGTRFDRYPGNPIFFQFFTID